MAKNITISPEPIVNSPFNFMEFVKNNITTIIIFASIIGIVIALILIIKKITIRLNDYDNSLQVLTNTVNSINESITKMHFGSIQDPVIPEKPKETFKVVKKSEEKLEVSESKSDTTEN